MSFNKLGLSAELLRAIHEQGYRQATPVQQQAIPLILESRDVLAGAQTGTGKTAGFTLPLLQRLQVSRSDEQRGRIRVLVLTPTRELAAQVCQSVRDYGRHLPFKAMEIVMAIGRGFSPDNAMRLLKGENALHVIDLREFVGKSPTQIERIKGRIIGEGGKARINMEHLSGGNISVYGSTVSIIGSPDQLKLAVRAIVDLSRGSMHGSVYGKLEAARRRNKEERMKLWEDQNVF